MSGYCEIKPEYRIQKVVEESTCSGEKGEDGTEQPPEKKQRLSNKEYKKLNKGQNKGRKLPFILKKHDNLCRSLYNGPTEKNDCPFENCKFLHDIDVYLGDKFADVGDTCPIYTTKGFCSFGITCRYAKNHIDENKRNIKQDWYNVANADSFNFLSSELQTILRKKTYDFSKSKEIAKKYNRNTKNENGESRSTDKPVEITCGKSEACETTNDAEANDVEANDAETDVIDANETHINEDAVDGTKRLGFSSDYDIVKERRQEKRQVDFRDKLVLSPLTTVGNLPFRRICKEYGADITCGEMACVVPIIHGISQEWALARRHASEDIFGVQLCGNNAELISYATQVLNENCDIDFFDLNIGCPIDLIYKQGGGSALIRRPPVLESIVRSCSELLNGTSFTVKTRTGVYTNKNVAHELAPKFESWGAKAVTIHGRSREQRYTRNSDWEYIEECAKAVKSIPIIGNGDILSYQDYLEAKKTAPHVASVMIGRGALYKPWIFQEIKEQRDIDLSSKDRLEMLRKYVHYGLEHWGSDTRGVEKARRFFLEWQSFLHRYVPYGLLANPPQKINERPYNYRGRDDLETLMASSNSADWIKLSEMILGKVPDNYNFVPKHKSNSYNG